MERSAWEKHNEALIERAVRLRVERKHRADEKLARERAELAATGKVVPYEAGPVAEVLAKLAEKGKARFKFW